MIFEWNLMKLSGTAVIKEILSNSSSILVVTRREPYSCRDRREKQFCGFVQSCFLLLISTNNISSLIAVLALEPTTRGLRALILLPLTFKTKRHFLSAFFIAGAGFEPATFGL